MKDLTQKSPEKIFLPTEEEVEFVRLDFRSALGIRELSNRKAPDDHGPGIFRDEFPIGVLFSRCAFQASEAPALSRLGVWTFLELSVDISF